MAAGPGSVRRFRRRRASSRPAQPRAPARNGEIAERAPFALIAPVDRWIALISKRTTRHISSSGARKVSASAPRHVDDRPRSHRKSIPFLNRYPEGFIATPIARSRTDAQIADGTSNRHTRRIAARTIRVRAANPASSGSQTRLSSARRFSGGAGEMREHRARGILASIHVSSREPGTLVERGQSRSRANILRASAGERS